MAPSTVDGSSNGLVKPKEEEGSTPLFEIDDSDLSRLLEKPRTLNIERKRSFDERSFSEMSITLSPPRNNNFYRMSDNSSRGFDNLDGVYSPGRWTGTPRSGYFEPHPIVGEAWEALRRSLVNFRGQPVGTIAALDNSSEELNYDQVKSVYRLVVFTICMMHDIRLLFVQVNWSICAVFCAIVCKT